MVSPFSVGSSPVDWCEKNYIFTPLIAEFANTLSNLIFLVLPPVLFHLFHQYGRFVNQGIHLVWALLFVVGLSSMYFHATLSLAGQLLDELSILWVVAAGFALWFPRRFLPVMCKGDREVFKYVILSLAVVSSILACYVPAINAFALMLLGIPACFLLMVQLKACDQPRIIRLGLRTAGIWGLAVCSWIIDRFCCEWVSRIGFPYLHSFWHILICLSSYSACVLYAYFEAKDEAPEQTPVLCFWPLDSFEWGVPYVYLRTGHYRPKGKRGSLKV